MWPWLRGLVLKPAPPPRPPHPFGHHPPPPPPYPTSPTTTTTTSSSSVRQRFPAQPLPPDATRFQSFRNEFLAQAHGNNAAAAAAPPVPDLEANAPNANPNTIFQALVDFYYTLFPRSEEFRTVYATRFTLFEADSTRRNDILWKSYKFVFLLSIYGVLSCVLAALFYSFFGEAKTSSPAHLHSFKFNSPAANTISLYVAPVIFTLVYGVLCSKKFWADTHFYQIREKYVAFVSLDLVVNLRIIKAVLLAIYSLQNFEKKWGDWTIVMFLLFPFFFTMSSISFLKLFEREFLNATGLLRDFAVILVGPCFTYLYQAYQHHHSHPLDYSHDHDHSLMKGLLYLIAILFGYISNQFIGFIYRPHTRNMRYAPEHVGNMNFGPIPHVRR